ncbi:MAG: DUF4382 domain-containing protein [Chitinophagaceae bacterium]
MKSKINLTLLCLLATTVIFYACQKDVSGNTPTTDLSKPHSVSIYLTDDQTPVFDSVFIDLQQLQVKVEDHSLFNDGWINITIRAGVYNILRFRNGLDTLFASGVLPNAKVEKIRLVLGTRNSVMKDGQNFPLKIHDDDREVEINLEADNFDITSAGQVLFWIDFDASRSIQVENSGSGHNNGFRLKSHIRLFAKSKSGSIEGRVLPAVADARVLAINGTDTTAAIPEDDNGEFKIVGLKAGSYTVFIDGQNNYRDTAITGVHVRNNEDAHLPTITLSR